MNDELIKVLEKFKTESGVTCNEWIPINMTTKRYHSSSQARCIIQILDHVPNQLFHNAHAFFLYRDYIKYIHYTEVMEHSMTCKSKKECVIKTDISGEGEYFQENTVQDLLDLEYDTYQLILEIIYCLDKTKWRYLK